MFGAVYILPYISTDGCRRSSQSTTYSLYLLSSIHSEYAIMLDLGLGGVHVLITGRLRAFTTHTLFFKFRPHSQVQTVGLV